MHTNLGWSGNNDDSVVDLRPDDHSSFKRVRNEENEAPAFASSSFEKLFVLERVIVRNFAVQEWCRESFEKSLQNKAFRRFNEAVVKDDGNARSHVFDDYFVHQVD